MKRGKKNMKQKNNFNPRVVVTMNTGQRRHKSKKDYDRKRGKLNLKREY
jgi:hypothetical protein